MGLLALVQLFLATCCAWLLRSPSDHCSSPPRLPPQVCCPDEKTKFVPLQWVEFPFVIQNLKWMNSRTLALIDTHEKLHLWDVRGQQQLEVGNGIACNL